MLRRRRVCFYLFAVLRRRRAHDSHPPRHRTHAWCTSGAFRFFLQRHCGSPCSRVSRLCRERCTESISWVENVLYLTKAGPVPSSCPGRVDWANDTRRVYGRCNCIISNDEALTCNKIPEGHQELRFCKRRAAKGATAHRKASAASEPALCAR